MARKLSCLLATSRNAFLSAWNGAIASSRDCYRHLISSDELSATRQELVLYWRIYGGLKALIKSPILWASVIISIICTPNWLSKDPSDLTISIMPNLLGFSIGAMAVVLAFPSGKAFKHFSEDGRVDSYYMDVASRFLHFIFAQLLALIIALICRAWPIFPFTWLSFLLLTYAIITAASTALTLFGVAQLYNVSPKGETEDGNETDRTG